MGKHKKDRSEKRKNFSLSNEDVERISDALYQKFAERKREKPSTTPDTSASENSTAESDTGSSSEERSRKSSKDSTTAEPNAKRSVIIRSPSKDDNRKSPEKAETIDSEKPEETDQVRNWLGYKAEEKVTAPAIHADVATAWEQISRGGLTADDRKELEARYPLMENCGLLEPPKLNPILKQIATKRIIERDDRLILKQHRFKTCLVGVAKLLSPLLAIRDLDKSYDPTIQVLCDLGRQCADGFYEENCIRKHFVIKDMVDTDWKPLLTDTVSDEYLFGAMLEDKIAAFRNLTKAAAELKPKRVTPIPKNLQVPPRPSFPKLTGGGQPKQFHQQFRPSRPSVKTQGFKRRRSPSQNRNYRARRSPSHNRPAPYRGKPLNRR